MNAKRTDLASEDFRQALARRLQKLGGLLRCSVDRTHGRPLGDVHQHLCKGWPRCCGQTMRWLTAKEIWADGRRLYHDPPPEDE